MSWLPSLFSDIFTIFFRIQFLKFEKLCLRFIDKVREKFINGKPDFLSFIHVIYVFRHTYIIFCQIFVRLSLPIFWRKYIFKRKQKHNISKSLCFIKLYSCSLLSEKKILCEKCPDTESFSWSVFSILGPERKYLFLYVRQ